MSFLEKLTGKSQEQSLIVGGAEGIEVAAAPTRDGVTILYWVSFGLLLVAMLGGYVYSSDLIRQSESLLKQYHQTLQEKATEEKNLEALQVLSAKVDTLKADQAVVEKAVPFDARYDQIVSFLEYSIKRLKKKYTIDLPENISWTQLSPDDVTNTDFQGFDILEYTFDYKGEYEGLISLLGVLREHERLLDVKTLQGMQLLKNGNVEVQVTFWAYNLVL